MKGIVLVTAVVTMLMVFITTLTSCDMQQQEIQGDKANEEFNGIDSAENGSGNDGNIDDSLLRSPDKDISDEDQSIIYDFSKQNAVYSNDALLYFFNREGNRLECEKRIVISAQADDYLKRVVEHLALGPKLKGLEPVIPKGVVVEKVAYHNKVVSVYLSKEFLKADDLLIARTALVNTILGAKPDAEYVKIYVDNGELTDNGKFNGRVLGLLNKYPDGLDEIKTREREKALGQGITHIYRELYLQDQDRKFHVTEIRPIVVKQGMVAEAVVGELLKGPSLQDQGLYPTLPKGTQLLEAKYVEGSDSSKGLELYFSDEFKTAYDSNINSEYMMLGSLVYSLVGLPEVEWLKIYYQDAAGEYVDTPVMTMNLQKKFNQESFPDLLGRKIKVYFSDKDVMNLVPEYRVISRSSEDIAADIIRELIKGPLQDDHVEVIPPSLSVEDITVQVDDKTAFVNLPSKINGPALGSAGEPIALCSIVNSLTDPVNTETVKQVQFLVDHKVVDEFGNMSLADPFVRNPALIKE